MLVNPSTEEPVAAIRAAASLAGAVAFARDRGGPALRALTFAERGELSCGLSKLIHADARRADRARARNGGNTRGDAKFDIDGAIGTLAHYAELGAKLGSARVLLDGEPDPARAHAAPGRPARAGAAPGRRRARQRVQLPGLGLGREGGLRAARRHAGDHQAGDRDRAGRAPHLRAHRGEAGAARGRVPAPARTGRATCSTTSAARTCSPSPARAGPARGSRATRGW